MSDDCPYCAQPDKCVYSRLCEGCNARHAERFPPPRRTNWIAMTKEEVQAALRAEYERNGRESAEQLKREAVAARRGPDLFDEAARRLRATPTKELGK